MKKMMIAWIVIAICLFGTLLFIGLRMDKSYKPYRNLEADMVEGATLYLTINEIKPKLYETMRIESDELLKSEVLSTMEVGEDKCKGYVTVKKLTSDYEYNAYIKCKDYVTVDYQE